MAAIVMIPSRRTSVRSAGQFFAIVGTVCAVAYALYGGFGSAVANLGILTFALAVATAASALKVAAPSDRAVVLRRGRLHALRGPGLFGINPIIDTVPHWVNVGALPIMFKPQPATRNMVDVSSAMFWKVFDPATVAFGQPAPVAHLARRPVPPIHRV